MSFHRRNFFRGWPQIAAQHGMLFIVDEVQSGIGRTGKMFAIEHAGVEPDIIIAAKGIASGLPMGVTIAREDVMDWPVGAHSNTFGGNPIACAAAMETMKLVREGPDAECRRDGALSPEALDALAERHRLIGDVRGCGLMFDIELVRNRQTKERATSERDALVDGRIPARTPHPCSGRKHDSALPAAGSLRGSMRKRRSAFWMMRSPKSPTLKVLVDSGGLRGVG